MAYKVRWLGYISLIGCCCTGEKLCGFVAWNGS